MECTLPCRLLKSALDPQLLTGVRSSQEAQVKGDLLHHQSRIWMDTHWRLTRRLVFSASWENVRSEVIML